MQFDPGVPCRSGRVRSRAHYTPEQRREHHASRQPAATTVQPILPGPRGPCARSPAGMAVLAWLERAARSGAKGRRGQGRGARGPGARAPAGRGAPPVVWPAWSSSSRECSPRSWPTPCSSRPRPGKRLGTQLVELGPLHERDLAEVLAEQLNLPLVDLRTMTPSPEAVALLPDSFARAQQCVPVSLAGRRPARRDGRAAPELLAGACRRPRARRSDRDRPRRRGPPHRRQHLPVARRDHAAGPGLRGQRRLGPGAACVAHGDRRRRRPGRPGRQHAHHPGACATARPTSTSSPRTTGSGCASASTAPCTTCSTLPDSHGPGARQPHQDHGRHEHRRAAAPAGRPDRDDRRRPRRSTSASSTHRHDLRREGRAAAARQVAAALPGSHDLGMPDDTHETYARHDPLALRHGRLRRPDRQRQDDDALRHAGRDQRRRAQHHDDRGPGRVRLPVDQPDPDQRAGRRHLRRRPEVDPAPGPRRHPRRRDPRRGDRPHRRQSALTGHLVLSSLHATDSVSALHRFLDMGIESFLVASSVRAVVGQRLVRRICDSCKEPYTPTAEELAFYERGRRARRRRSSAGGEGCNFCAGTGYSRPHRRLRAAAGDRRDARADRRPGHSHDEMRALAVEQGMRTARATRPSRWSTTT